MATRSSALQLLSSLSPGTFRIEKSPEFLGTNVASLDAVVQGFPRGAITEIFGPPSSGRTTVLHSFLHGATRAGEYCALIDASHSFDPESAKTSGINLSNLLWIKCVADNDKARMEKALKCVDLVLHGGGWGVIVLDLGDLSPQWVRKLPVSYWYRFRRAIEPTPTAMVVLEREPYVRACASLALEMQPARPDWQGAHADFRILQGAEVQVVPKKPVMRNTAVFQANALRAG